MHQLFLLHQTRFCSSTKFAEIHTPSSPHPHNTFWYNLGEMMWKYAGLFGVLYFLGLSHVYRKIIKIKMQHRTKCSLLWILPSTPHAKMASMLNLLTILWHTVQYYHPVDRGAVYIPHAVSCSSWWSYLYPQICIPSRPETTALQF